MDKKEGVWRDATRRFRKGEVVEDDAQLNLLQALSALAQGERDYRVAEVSFVWAMGQAGEGGRDK